MKKSMVRFGAMILPLVFSMVACNTPTTPTTSGYDGRIFDISVNQDQSLTAKSEKVDNYYTLTISGAGAAVDYTKKEAVPWNPIIKKINKVTINEGITNIGDYFFHSLPLDYFILPSTVTSIGEHSFNEVSKIYSFGPKIEDTTRKIYYYSEEKPTGYGDYFFLDEDGKPQLWEIKSVLFIGNSFTYYEGSSSDPRVPDFFQQIAANLNKDTSIDWVINGGHTLAKFGSVNDQYGAIVEQKLKENQYDYVILQEQSTTPINNYNSFEQSVKNLKAKIDNYQNNASVILYETWGSPTGIQNTKYKTVGEMEADLREAYRKCGEETECKVHYVGKAFTTAYETTDINIYYSDDRHQNNYGSYLSAAVHIKEIFGVNVENCTTFCGLNEAKCKTLLKIAQAN